MPDELSPSPVVLPPPITRLIAEGVLDAELAGLLWLLLGSDLPLVVSGPPATVPAQLAAALEYLADRETSNNGRAERPVWLLEEESLEAVFTRLSSPPTALEPDQLRGLGLVLVLHVVEGVGRRLAAAYYIRPPERDAAGHVQRRPPALLAARDESGDRLEHYAWGITSELAERLGQGAARFEAAHRRRQAFLAAQVAAGVLDLAELRRAVGEFLRGERH